MQKIRVLVANQPRMMRDLVLAIICDQPDIEVVGEIEDASRIAQSVDESRPDFVIVGLDRPDQRPPICDYILAHHPLTKVLAVPTEYDKGVFFWSDIQSVAIESSEDGILSAIRGKAKPVFGRVM
jgi:DNA-binding NarL/FixJ family response regulator